MAVSRLASLTVLGAFAPAGSLSLERKANMDTHDHGTHQSWAWADSSKSATARAEALLTAMDPLEKTNMIHGTCMQCPYVGYIPGIPRLGIPPLNEHDGPQGFRNEPFAKGTSTSWPGAMAMSATFDPEAVYDWGYGIGKEFRDKGSNVALGPGLNLARIPVNGRNFEYLSGEDPYLGYVLAKPVVRGIQEHKVIATGKHFVGNSQEANRNAVSEDIDDRTLFEMYYPPFEGAVEAGIGSIMCSYNRLNGDHSCENPTTLGHLKKDLGFQGFVMSDWFATHSPSLGEGLDQEMPMGQFTNPLALLLTKTKPEDVDTAVKRILRTMFKIGVMDENTSTWTHKENFLVNVSTPEHIDTARRLSADSTVLLQNRDAVLPLPANKSLALIGFADENAFTLAFGRGSGEVYPSYYVSPLAGIGAAAGEAAQVSFDNGTNLTRAAEVARNSDYAIVFVGASASEGGDRYSLSLDGACYIPHGISGKPVKCKGNDAHQNDMIRAVAKANPKTIVVASVSGAFLMPWRKDVAAILTNFMPGQEAGNAIADVLFGKVNPSAKLPITMPNVENEAKLLESQYPGELREDMLHHSEYAEKLLVGYRYYDANNISFTTGFPFGHGLSYTSFKYDNLKVNRREVSFTVENTGSVPGREVAQLYLGFPAAAGEPPLQLKGFKKTALLEPGAKELVALVLRERDTSIYNSTRHRWTPVHGSFALNVGSSSRSILLQASAEL